MESSDPVPKAFPLERIILIWYHIHDLHDYGNVFTKYVKKTGIEVNVSYNK